MMGRRARLKVCTVVFFSVAMGGGLPGATFSLLSNCSASVLRKRGLAFTLTETPKHCSHLLNATPRLRRGHFGRNRPLVPRGISLLHWRLPRFRPYRNRQKNWTLGQPAKIGLAETVGLCIYSVALTAPILPKVQFQTICWGRATRQDAKTSDPKRLQCEAVGGLQPTPSLGHR